MYQLKLNVDIHISMTIFKGFFYYFVRVFVSEPSTFGHFQKSESIFEAKLLLIILKTFLLSDYQDSRTCFFTALMISTILKKVYTYDSVKMCPNFFSSDSKYLTQYQKSL